MIDDNIIVKEAEEYVSNNKTVEETAKDLGISKRTLQLHFKRLQKINENLHKKVLEKQETAQQIGRIKGGQVGKSHSHFTKEQAEKIANTIITKALSYKDAEEEFGLPKSTIYEVVHSDLVSRELRDKLDILAEANIHDITVEELAKSKK